MKYSKGSPSKKDKRQNKASAILSNASHLIKLTMKREVGDGEVPFRWQMSWASRSNPQTGLSRIAAMTSIFRAAPSLRANVLHQTLMWWTRAKLWWVERKQNQRNARWAQAHSLFQRVARDEPGELHLHLPRAVRDIVSGRREANIGYPHLFNCFQTVAQVRPDLVPEFMELVHFRSKDGHLLAFMATRKGLSLNEDTVKTVLDHDDACGSNWNLLMERAVILLVEAGSCSWLAQAARGAPKTPCGHLHSGHPLRHWMTHVGQKGAEIDRELAAQALNQLALHGFLADQPIRFRGGEHQGFSHDYPNALAMACQWHDLDLVSANPIWALLDHGQAWGNLDFGEGAGAEAIRAHPAWRRAQLRVKIESRADRGGESRPRAL